MDVYELSRSFRKQLDDRDVRSMRYLARLYAPVLREIDAEIRRALFDLESNPNRVYRLIRLRRLRDAIAAEVRKFSQSVAPLIAAAQNEALDAGAEHSLLQMRVAAASVGINATFSLPNLDALRHLVGVLVDGSPVRKLLDSYGKEAGKLAVRILIQGMGRGESPNAVARELHLRMQMPLRRAQMLSRNEMLRAYRSATLDSYRRNSDVVRGWIWLSAANSRTCPVCWAMHGTFHPLSERFASHVACRCTQVPAVRGAMPVVRGEELFRNLPDTDKAAILGQGKYSAYRDGRLTLPDLVAKGRSETWGNYRRERTMKELKI